MLSRLLLLLLISFLPLRSAFAQSDAASARRIPDNCPVTRQFQSNIFIPPFPYPAAPSSPNGFWFGTDRLWTSLPPDGLWGGIRGVPGSKRAYREKVFYWRVGYDARLEQPPLVVTGTRLDAPAPALATDEHANGGWNESDKPFMVIGVNLPTPGCWKITGRYRDDELTFVVWVDY